jgi:hypothetical protein
VGCDADKTVLKPARPSIQGEGQPGNVCQLLFNPLLILVMLFFDLDKYGKGKDSTKNEFEATAFDSALLIKIRSAGTLPCH